MTLAGRLEIRRGAFELDLELTVPSGSVLALLGPNGAGKTTALRALAGLVPRLRGRVTLDDDVLDDDLRGIHVPTERRPVGMVFQDYLLLPHLSTLENVAFGLRARGTARRPARAEAGRWLDRVGLAAYAQTRPGQLSGGQAQRVALARALVTEPRLLLLDEPLAALDASTRLDIRVDLRRHLDAYDGSTVLVTHDPIDAMVLADRIAVLESGRVVQDGTPAEVARAPRTDYVARLVGLNLLRGTAHDGRARLVDGAEVVIADRVEGAVLVAISPAAVALFLDRPVGSPRNCWPARVERYEQFGDTVRVHLAGAVPVMADVTPAALAELGLAAGSEVWAAVKATETHAYPA